MHAATLAQREVAPVARDWVQWYEDLERDERESLRHRLVDADIEKLRADTESRTFFLFHVEDLLADEVPGTRRMGELHHVVMALRGASEPEQVEQRRRAVSSLLASYQEYLRANLWLS